VKHDRGFLSDLGFTEDTELNLVNSGTFVNLTFDRLPPDNVEEVGVTPVAVYNTDILRILYALL
jgi:hypothetical protein